MGGIKVWDNHFGLAAQHCVFFTRFCSRSGQQYISFVFCGSRVSTRNSFEMRVDHVTIWAHADGAPEDEPHADEFE